MSVKIFGKGLGLVDHPFDISQPVPITGISSTKSRIERDTNSFKIDGEIKTIQEDGMLRSTIQLPNADIRRKEETNTRLTVRTGVRPQVFSDTSGDAPFETFFHDFDIQVFPFYNFWVADELTNESSERGDRKLDEIPRFMKVVWNISPDLPDPDVKVVPKQVNKKTTNPIIFALELERPTVFRAKGVDFTPEHLQPRGLSSIKGIIANGHLAPGVLETIVDLPLANAGLVTPSLNDINLDEDVFLNDPTTRGISIHELKGQHLQLTNGTVSSAAIGRDGVSLNVVDQKNQLVDGKFNIVKSMESGGSMLIQGVHPSSPTISITAKTAVSARLPIADHVQEMIQKVSQPTPFTASAVTAQAKVKFIDPSIGGLIGIDKVKLMSAPEHLEAMVAIAPSLPSLELLARSNYQALHRKIEIPSLPSPRMKPLEYIGYIIEKYKRTPTGVFTKVDEFDIPNREIDTFYDTKVLYGEIYRYRIKAVLRWTRAANHDVQGSDPTVAPRFASPTMNLASHKSSYLVSEWSHRWAYGTCMDDQPPSPPDELNVRVESHKKRVVITFRLPDNPQKDILSMRLFRKLQDEQGRDVTDWLPLFTDPSVQRTVDFAPQNVLFFDTDVEFFQTGKKRYVYCAQTVTRHGEDSVLSEQYAARLNQDYFSRGEYPVEFISSNGVRFEYFGNFSTVPHRITKMELVATPPVAKAKGSNPGVAAVILAGRNTLGNVYGISSDYVLRIQSLDTGETRDIPFSMLFQNMKTRERLAVLDAHSSPGESEKKNSDNFDSDSETILQKLLARYQDPELIGSEDDSEETFVYDRSTPNERW